MDLFHNSTRGELMTPPCNHVCPAGNDVQGFLHALARDDADEALRILLETSPLPAVCGRVCPAPCMDVLDRILGLGAQVVTDHRIDRQGLLELAKSHDAVLVATGLQELRALRLGTADSEAVVQVKAALAMEGLRFFLIRSPCPTGWKSEPAESVRLVRLAVETGLFLLYEVFNGRFYRIN
ncbi:MAG: hypothetical protein GY856_29110, partial [bacterium]|nr:hypothetical protein [bacterium]